MSKVAPTCPHCGHPIATATGTQKPKPSGGKGSPVTAATGEQPPEPNGWFRRLFGGRLSGFIACSLVLAGIIGTVVKGCSGFQKTNKEINDFKMQVEEGQKRQKQGK